VTILSRPFSPSWRLLLPALLLTFGFFFPGKAGGVMERQFIFFPEKELLLTPDQVHLPFREVYFPAADGVLLHGWLIPGEPAAPLVLFMHGNAGNISHRLDNLLLLRQQLGVSIFIFDYRGYGRSTGTPSEQGTYDDARGALTWLQSEGWESARTFYFGRSLGAAVALQLALEQRPAGLILETPFTSIPAMGRHHYPLLWLLLGWSLDARYDNLHKISENHAPLLILQGDRDAIVPEAMARQLFARANEPKIFHLIRRAGHNDTYETGGNAYWQVWRDFVRKSLE
jgi:uncharacterized protein